MRQKKLKFVSNDLMKEEKVIIEKEKIDVSKYSKVFLEIGSGKGHFISKLAADNPDYLYIALEKNISVCYRIVEKRNELKLTNLLIVLLDSKDLLEILEEHTIDLIYLNFSDPWPKARHHKRRLTYDTFLKLYVKLLKENGKIQFRTDHLDLFNDSILYVSKYFSILNINRNHQMDKYYTEYEEKKSKLGNIYELLGEVLYE